MKILVELPTWLGDTVMASEAFGHIANNATEIVLVGSKAAVDTLKNHPKVKKTVIIDRKNRYKKLFSIPKSDMAISFRSHLFSKILTRLSSPSFFTYKKPKKQIHQVKKYHDFIEKVFEKTFPLGKPTLHYGKKSYERPTVGINPGATYGSAKRWYPAYFAQVINSLGPGYDYVIFGGPSERDIAKEIEDLAKFPVKNLAGKTTIEELISSIAGLNLFITNDSGPMHIAAAYDVPTVALFGPTNHKETSPYSKNAKILRLNLECAPCMKRVCPLKHHRCMVDLKPEYVIEAIKELQKETE